MSYYDHSQSPVEFAYNNNGKNMRAINWNDIKDVRILRFGTELLKTFGYLKKSQFRMI